MMQPYAKLILKGLICANGVLLAHAAIAQTVLPSEIVSSSSSLVQMDWPKGRAPGQALAEGRSRIAFSVRTDSVIGKNGSIYIRFGDGVPKDLMLSWRSLSGTFSNGSLVNQGRVLIWTGRVDGQRLQDRFDIMVESAGEMPSARTKLSTVFEFEEG
jgi:hypothetical protein